MSPVWAASSWASAVIDDLLCVHWRVEADEFSERRQLGYGVLRPPERQGRGHRGESSRGGLGRPSHARANPGHGLIVTHDPAAVAVPQSRFD